jgi:hypothetical protein
MSLRDELKALLDQLPEPYLPSVESVVQHLLMQNVAEDQLQVPTETGDLGGRDWSGVYHGVRFGGETFRQFDNGAIVERTLQFVGDHQLETVQRISFSSDGTKLLCSFTVSSGGQKYRHEDEFPTSPREKSGSQVVPADIPLLDND